MAPLPPLDDRSTIGPGRLIGNTQPSSAQSLLHLPTTVTVRRPYYHQMSRITRAKLQRQTTPLCERLSMLLAAILFYPPKNPFKSRRFGEDCPIASSRKAAALVTPDQAWYQTKPDESLTGTRLIACTYTRGIASESGRANGRVFKEDEGLWVQVADGPVVSTVFRDAERLLTCSLLGSIAEFKISRDSSGMLQAEKTWSSSTSSMEKVNAIAASQFRLVIGGFGKDGKGVVEVWRNGESARLG
ncbi:hypothetical protein NUW54_g12539 [Trametes sanguinea]|uniref:Uncharacterized protein n=1 Tax=Trametes sanguinea TaxID=158606 RepID=A0ACC1MWA7_9APHY|nr:hypothetical protein NUW54_g12539 [Trametes sanguinea]